MLKLKPYAHYLIVFGLIMLLLTVGQLGAGHTAWAAGANFQTVPTRTPTPNPNNGSGSNGDHQDDDTDTSSNSKILGEVRDLSSGKPGAGITVRINAIEIKTDTTGHYSLSGLGAGEYVISLVLEGEAVPAQEPVVVTVDGKTDVTVNLAYYSVPTKVQAIAAPTAMTTNRATNTTPSNQSVANVATSGQTTGTLDSTPPQVLPVTGEFSHNTWLIFGVGLISLLLGLKLHYGKS